MSYHYVDVITCLCLRLIYSLIYISNISCYQLVAAKCENTLMTACCGVPLPDCRAASSPWDFGSWHELCWLCCRRYRSDDVGPQVRLHGVRHSWRTNCILFLWRWWEMSGPNKNTLHRRWTLCQKQSLKKRHQNEKKILCRNCCIGGQLNHFSQWLHRNGSL